MNLESNRESEMLIYWRALYFFLALPRSLMRVLASWSIG